MSHKTAHSQHSNAFILALNRRIYFIARKTGESEETIRDLLLQYSMAAIAYGDEQRSLLRTMLFLAGLYILKIQKGHTELHVEKPLRSTTHRLAHKNR